MSRPDADLIIAGAGCAGLSALWHALRSPARDRRIVVVDRDFEPSDDRTWAFWGNSETPFAHLADHHWDRLCVRFPDWESTGDLHGRHRRTAAGRGDHRRTYMRVRRRDFDRAVLDAASSHPNVRFVAGDIVGIRNDRNGGCVELTDGELHAPVVFQSARLAPHDRDTTVHHPLRQHFGGWEVRTEHAVFDPGVATLMDFDVEQHDGVAFFYVLPEAPDRALVEHTMFSLHPRSRRFHDEQVAAQLRSLGAGAVEVTRTEYGTIPMEDRRLHQRWGRHVWNIGTVGGMTKPTTGYTFQRIQAQTRHLVAAWSEDRELSPLPRPPRRFAFADRTLLNILHHRPDRGRPIFEQLFRSTPIDHVLTFLDEDSTLVQDARLVSKLPWPPFLRAAAVELSSGSAAAVRAHLPGRAPRTHGRHGVTVAAA